MQSNYQSEPIQSASMHRPITKETKSILSMRRAHRSVIQNSNSVEKACGSSVLKRTYTNYPFQERKLEARWNRASHPVFGEIKHLAVILEEAFLFLL